MHYDSERSENVSITGSTWFAPANRRPETAAGGIALATIFSTPFFKHSDRTLCQLGDSEFPSKPRACFGTAGRGEMMDIGKTGDKMSHSHLETAFSFVQDRMITGRANEKSLRKVQDAIGKATYQYHYLVPLLCQSRTNLASVPCVSIVGPLAESGCMHVTGKRNLAPFRWANLKKIAIRDTSARPVTMCVSSSLS